MCRGMSRDTKYYDDPEQFNLGRYLGDSKELDPYRYVFGFGRRCATLLGWITFDSNRRGD